jgi:hypothetical protein
MMVPRQEEGIVQTLKATRADVSFDVDPVEEMRLRTWARRNYLPEDERDQNWHPIVLEEMVRKDHEHSRAVRPR